MKPNYYFTIEYPPRSFDRPPRLSLIIPELLCVQLLINRVQVDSGEHWFVKQLREVLDGKTDHIRSGDGETIDIDIYPDDSVVCPHGSEPVTIPTPELYSLIIELVNAKKELREAYNDETTWHNLPTRLKLEDDNKPDLELIRYFNPQTGKAGYFKDLPEGKGWMEAAKKEQIT